MAMIEGNDEHINSQYIVLLGTVLVPGGESNALILETPGFNASSRNVYSDVEIKVPWP